MSEEPSRKSKRVTGLLILGSLAVILIPALFDFQEDRHGAPSIDTQGVQIPQKYQSRIVPLDEAALINPEFDELPIRPIAGKEAIKPSSAEVNEANLAPPRIELGPADTKMLELGPVEAPRLEERLGLVAWVVQLGSFKDADRALKLRDQLRSKSWPAFTEQILVGDESKIRVRVGPELDKDQAEKLRKAILSELGIDGMVIRYPSK